MKLAILALALAFTSETLAQTSDENPALVKTITDLDAAVFDAYNRCDLEIFASYFTKNVEFYHDKGGVTWDRKTVIENTRKYICHKVRRELVPGSLKIYPINGYGAIEEGEHRFCQSETGACEGIAKFVMIWENRKSKWQMTRVLSFGHRPNQP